MKLVLTKGILMDFNRSSLAKNSQRNIRLILPNYLSIQCILLNLLICWMTMRTLSRPKSLLKPSNLRLFDLSPSPPLYLYYVTWLLLRLSASCKKRSLIFCCPILGQNWQTKIIIIELIVLYFHCQLLFQ